MVDRLTEMLALATRICRGEIPDHDQSERFTVGAFDLLLIKAKGAEAFAMLQELCDRYPGVISDDDVRRGFFMLLALLAQQSETTQLPGGLTEIVAQNPDLSAELRAWYRVPG